MMSLTWCEPNSAVSSGLNTLSHSITIFLLNQIKESIIWWIYLLSHQKLSDFGAEDIIPNQRKPVANKELFPLSQLFTWINLMIKGLMIWKYVLSYLSDEWSPTEPWVYLPHVCCCAPEPVKIVQPSETNFSFLLFFWSFINRDLLCPPGRDLEAEHHRGDTHCQGEHRAPGEQPHHVS